MIGQTPVCAHCGETMLRMSIPPEGGYDSTFLFVCFNEDCSYYVDGWSWMFEKYHARVSYRYRIDPATGGEGPLAVWSPAALRDLIIPQER